MEVRARAPGKTILSGEHAVVHGSAAIAASIDLYTYISLRFPIIPESDDALKLHLKDIGIELSWPVEKIKDVLPSCTPIFSTPKSCPQDSLKSIAALVEEQNILEAKIGLASGVSAFLWMYTSIQG
ncbi:unnamed protein product [Rhodiola kirilowii]